LGEADGLREEDGVRRPIRGRVLLLAFIASGFLFPESALGRGWAVIINNVMLHNDMSSQNMISVQFYKHLSIFSCVYN